VNNNSKPREHPINLIWWRYPVFCDCCVLDWDFFERNSYVEFREEEAYKAETRNKVFKKFARHTRRFRA
jgi:hypothetical protein